MVLYNSPGIKDFTNGLAGQIRGGLLMDGVLYVVAGSTFYSISATGVATSIGQINTSVGRISMASNRASPKELCLVDGTDGWIYDTSGGLARIVDADFAAADTVTFQDGYFLFNEAGTSRFFISGIDDGTAYSAADFADAESNSDDIVAVFSNQQQILVFKTSVIEIYYNSGNADFPFERVSGGVIQRGCAAAFSIAEEDNTLFFFADDGTIRRIDGSTPVRVSTHAIEEIIREMPTTADAFAYFITISGHKFYHLTFPTGGRTFVYDVATKLWHERESFGQAYFRASFYIRAYGKDLVGDVFAGRIGELDQEYVHRVWRSHAGHSYRHTNSQRSS